MKELVIEDLTKRILRNNYIFEQTVEFPYNLKELESSVHCNPNCGGSCGSCCPCKISEIQRYKTSSS